MQSALFHRGLIEQIPAVVYAATRGKPRRVGTPLGTISFHRLPAELFFGYEIEADGSKIATAEKALFDTLYLAPAAACSRGCLSSTCRASFAGRSCAGWQGS